jgi:hypothetical protein
MNFQSYFKEGFTPQSGIDTITVWLHPSIINRFDQFHKQGNNNQPINLRFSKEVNSKTNIEYRTNFLVDIQAEAINPYYNILDQVLTILVNLTYEGILHYPQFGQHITDLKSFFYNNFERFFSIDRLDFYFDLRNGDMRLLGKPNPVYPNTRYSLNYPSVLKAYFRTAKLIQKRCISNEEIENIEYPNRIEFSLRRENCDFLNVNNLTGSYEDVFLRYLPFLARKWNDYRGRIVKVEERNLSYAHHLRQVIVASRHRTQHYYYLLHTPLKPIPHKSAKRNEVDYDFIPQFYSRG